ncbi:HEAT repeat domain-containing protein [Pseudomonas sp. PS02302]|uniref:HEAT repeat domain-containing protein n=1 Tax=Pseudomonas sp. PS02302 TaxID=2991428 RepID=UPI00249CDB77|nr:HEAT repeat domain-containing protein [Pseudomonas sp. PS02302]
MTINIIEELSKILRNSFLEEEVRAEAALSIAEFGSEEAVKLLIEIIEKGGQPVCIRIAAIKGLGKIGAAQQLR